MKEKLKEKSKKKGELRLMVKELEEMAPQAWAGLGGIWSRGIIVL
jgi:hypothetical protein